jgi:plasmid stabilization system protein ParE
VAWRVGWTEAALEDLSATAEYIARDSARYASTFTRNAFAASDTLGCAAVCVVLEAGRRLWCEHEDLLAGESK